MTIIVTGAAGFIGSNIVKALNQRGITDIVAVDNLSKGEKFKNLAECEIAHYLDKHEFIRQVRGHLLPYDDIEAVFHQGACSDTMNHDGLYMMENNYQYTLDLWTGVRMNVFRSFMPPAPQYMAREKSSAKSANWKNRSMYMATLNSCLTKYCAAA